MTQVDQQRQQRQYAEEYTGLEMNVLTENLKNFISDARRYLYGEAVREGKTEPHLDLDKILKHLWEQDRKKKRNPADAITLQTKVDTELLHCLRVANLVGQVNPDLIPHALLHNRLVNEYDKDGNEKVASKDRNKLTKEFFNENNIDLVEFEVQGMLVDLLECLGEISAASQELRSITFNGSTDILGSQYAETDKLKVRALGGVNTLMAVLEKLRAREDIQIYNAGNNGLSSTLDSVGILVTNIANTLQSDAEVDAVTMLELQTILIEFVVFAGAKNKHGQTSYLGDGALLVYAANIYDNLMNPKADDEGGFAPSNTFDVFEAMSFLIPTLEMVNQQEMVKKLKRATALHDLTKVSARLPENARHKVSRDLTIRQLTLNIMRASTSLSTDDLLENPESKGFFNERLSRAKLVLEKRLRRFFLGEVEPSDDKVPYRILTERTKGARSTMDKLFKYFDKYDAYVQAQFQQNPGDTPQPFSVEWLEIVMPVVSDMVGFMVEIDVDNLEDFVIKGASDEVNTKIKELINIARQTVAFDIGEDEIPNNEKLGSISKRLRVLSRAVFGGSIFFADPRGRGEAYPEMTLRRDFRNVNMVIDVDGTPVEIQFHFRTKKKSRQPYLGSTYILKLVGPANHNVYKFEKELNRQIENETDANKKAKLVKQKERLIDLFTTSMQRIYQFQEQGRAA